MYVYETTLKLFRQYRQKRNQGVLRVRNKLSIIVIRKYVMEELKGKINRHVVGTNFSICKYRKFENVEVLIQK